MNPPTTLANPVTLRSGKIVRAVFLLLLTAVFSSGCISRPAVHRAKISEAHGAEKDRHLLVGKWRGEARVKEGGSKIWLIERFEDGTFVIHFRNVGDDGSTDDDTEYGDWGLSADVYFTMTRGWIRAGEKQPVSARQSYFDDAYLVRQLTPEKFVYESVSSGDVFSTNKVADDFTLP